MVWSHKGEGVEQLNEVVELARSCDEDPEMLLFNIPLDGSLPVEPATFDLGRKIFIKYRYHFQGIQYDRKGTVS